MQTNKFVSICISSAAENNP